MSDRRDLALAILSKVIELESDDWISYLKRYAMILFFFTIGELFIKLTKQLYILIK